MSAYGLIDMNHSSSVLKQCATFSVTTLKNVEYWSSMQEVHTISR